MASAEKAFFLDFPPDSFGGSPPLLHGGLAEDVMESAGNVWRKTPSNLVEYGIRNKGRGVEAKRQGYKGARM